MASNTHLPAGSDPPLVIPQPLLWSEVAEFLVPLLDIYGPVDEVQVEVLQLQVLQGILASWKDIITTMLCVPVSMCECVCTGDATRQQYIAMAWE